MAEFKKAPGTTGGTTGEPLMLHANQMTLDTPREGRFSLEQWAVIAGAGMAISLLMIVAGMVVSWRRQRRRKRTHR
ncbi:MAG: hypothetical protein RQ752_04885 [Thermohalobaculum sp.]|nr:hypothetical protein [Thermohalobaculum sp.]